MTAWRTTRRISSFKSRMFRGLLTYTNDLRVSQRKKNHKELSHMTMVAIDVTITRDETIRYDKKFSQLVHVAQ